MFGVGQFNIYVLVTLLLVTCPLIIQLPYVAAKAVNLHPIKKSEPSENEASQNVDSSITPNVDVIEFNPEEDALLPDVSIGDERKEQDPTLPPNATPIRQDEITERTEDPVSEANSEELNAVPKDSHSSPMSSPTISQQVELTTEETVPANPTGTSEPSEVPFMTTLSTIKGREETEVSLSIITVTDRTEVSNSSLTSTTSSSATAETAVQSSQHTSGSFISSASTVNTTEHKTRESSLTSSPIPTGSSSTSLKTIVQSDLLTASESSYPPSSTTTNSVTQAGETQSPISSQTDQTISKLSTQTETAVNDSMRDQTPIQTSNEQATEEEIDTLKNTIETTVQSTETHIKLPAVLGTNDNGSGSSNPLVEEISRPVRQLGSSSSRLSGADILAILVAHLLHKLLDFVPV